MRRLALLWPALRNDPTSRTAGGNKHDFSVRCAPHSVGQGCILNPFRGAIRTGHTYSPERHQSYQVPVQKTARKGGQVWTARSSSTSPGSLADLVAPFAVAPDHSCAGATRNKRHLDGTIPVSVVFDKFEKSDILGSLSDGMQMGP